MQASDSNASRLGIYMVGVGAVASTLVAGVELIRTQKRYPVGSLTQLGKLKTAAGALNMSDVLGLAQLDDLVFGGVDLVEADVATAARTAGVLNEADLTAVENNLGQIQLGAGWGDPDCVRELEITRARPEVHRGEQVEAMIADMRQFIETAEAARGVVLLTCSTEVAREPGTAHASIDSFRAALAANDPTLLPSQLYAWAAIEVGLPVVNCTPNPVLEVPAIRALAEERGVAIAGSDLKSGQTYLKTIIGSALGKRLLGVEGWYSTNYLGNRDGLVLNDPENFRAKELTKGGALKGLLDESVDPELYRDLVHQVHIHYHPPAGDNKEAWDAIQLYGWLGYKMELKLNFSCRDSILAAPLVLDLALLIDAAATRKSAGVQSWLAHYFKYPAFNAGEERTHDVQRQFELFHRRLTTWTA